jgi:RimJ/RimL family protein N-acetyltransferase
LTPPLIETERLALRCLTLEDAPFIRALVNDPDWIRYIGDRKVRTDDDARRYIVDGPMKMYERHGFGLWLVRSRDDAAPMGLCGLVKRDRLEDVDLGFAFLPAFRARGYAFEAASAVLHHARSVLGVGRILAIVTPENAASQRLLRRLGFGYESTIDWDKGEQVQLFACNVPE